MNSPGKHYNDDEVGDDVDDHEKRHHKAIERDDNAERTKPGGGIYHVTNVCVGTPEMLKVHYIFGVFRSNSSKQMKSF